MDHAFKLLNELNNKRFFSNEYRQKINIYLNTRIMITFNSLVSGLSSESSCNSSIKAGSISIVATVET